MEVFLRANFVSAEQSCPKGEVPLYYESGSITSHLWSKCKCSCALPNCWLLLVFHTYQLKKFSRPPVMPDWGNWSPGLWKLATISLFLTDSSGLFGDTCIWISRAWQGCRLWIRGGLIWALFVLSLDFLRQETTSLLTVLWFFVYWRHTAGIKAVVNYI